jgi:ATP-binding cassette, subfamily A (ABC1), member 3
VGTIESLASRYASYEVHFSCRTREETTKAQEIMARIPGARLVDDVATRFEVPISGDEAEGGMSLRKLFHLLSTQTEFSDYTVERATLESAFLKVIKESHFAEQDAQRKPAWWKV